MLRPRFSRSRLRPRLVVCVAIVGAAFVVLLGRLAYLQIWQGARYRYLSENNRIRVERIPAPRGMMFDRNGEILADVRAAFEALVVPSEVPAGETELGAWLERVSEILGMPSAEIRRVLEGNRPARWEPRFLSRITRAQMARLEAHRLELPGMLVRARPVRHYPQGPLFGPVLGYVGEVSARELGSDAFAEYAAGDVIGRAGVERTWEATLRGTPGGQQVEVDVRGRELRVLAERPPKAGRNLVLALDRRLQEAAREALGDRVGAVAVVDVRTGDVLALVTSPSLDPNELVRGVSAQRWKEIVSDPLHPLQNRAVSGQYPPGSTFKVAVALAGLAEGVITPRTRVYCSGAYRFAGRDYRCWKKAGHGWVDLKRALVESCDVYFYQLGLDLGVDQIARWASELGLGKETGVDLPGERPGLLPTRAWKRRARGKPWYAGETLSVAIGQGYVLTTPLQMAAAMAAVAHPQGIRFRPRLVTRIEDPAGRVLHTLPPEEVGRLPFSLAQLSLVRKALRQVVAGAHGTARRADVEGFPVAGKTGTAQVVKLPSERNLPIEQIPWEHRDHAWFTGYAPADDPRIAFAVLVEHGGHGGSAAGPVAARVVEAYRDLVRSGLAAQEAPR
ncbi:penicillin-binding protein 2 [Deferrisoma camini]|uniref:penicillin-binding protein 2 n=1 Tax=Deferrisoma camini TaxID=1035120 RepID=UPI00046CCE5C|nr:penicillin-binding protein 2 [Deferrisoma camini]